MRRRHYPVCNCNGDWFSEFDDVLGDGGRGGYLFQESTCPLCLMYHWWTEANDQHMNDLREMNACQ